MRKNRFILFIVITAISLAFGGCSESISETDQHRYFSKGGKFYIHYEQDYTEDPQLYYVESPVYDSYDEMIAVLTENIATDETREYLQRRYGDKNGNIRVFDADGMKQATHPDFEFFKLSFNNKVAGSYDIILKHRLDSITQALRVTVFPDADIYDEHFEEDTAYYVTHEKTESAELPEKNAKEYYFDSCVRDSRYSSSLGCTLGEYREYKALHYSLSASEDKSIYVIENYEKEKGVFGDMPTDISLCQGRRCLLPHLHRVGVRRTAYRRMAAFFWSGAIRSRGNQINLIFSPNFFGEKFFKVICKSGK